MLKQIKFFSLFLSIHFLFLISAPQTSANNSRQITSISPPEYCHISRVEFLRHSGRTQIRVCERQSGKCRNFSQPISDNNLEKAQELLETKAQIDMVLFGTLAIPFGAIHRGTTLLAQTLKSAALKSSLLGAAEKLPITTSFYLSSGTRVSLKSPKSQLIQLELKNAEYVSSSGASLKTLTEAEKVEATKMIENINLYLGQLGHSKTASTAALAATGGIASANSILIGPHLQLAELALNLKHDIKKSYSSKTSDCTYDHLPKIEGALADSIQLEHEESSAVGINHEFVTGGTP